MRNVLRISLVARICILGVVATSARLSQAASQPPRSAEERLANAHATVVRADAEWIKTQASWIQTLYQVRKIAAETAKILQEVRSLQLDNQVKTCETYFKKRERRDQYRSQHPRVRLDHEAYVRVCNATKPKRLLKYQYDPDRGKIFWPRLLQRPEFQQYREELDALFALRSAGSADSCSEFQHRVHSLSRQMQNELRCMVREVNQMEYAAAKKFIRGLAYEAQLPPQLEAVAANTN